MRRIYTIILFLLAYSPLAFSANNDVTYLPDIEIGSSSIVKEGRTVRLNMDFDLSQARINTQHTVALIPVLISKDGQKELAFPSVIIDGKTRNNVYLRAQRLSSVEMPIYHDDDAQVIIRRRNGKEQQYDYEATAAYERWMLDGRVELREEVHGCVNCQKGESEQGILDDVLPTYIPDYQLESIAPEPEPTKQRSITRTARVQFRRDKYDILPDFKNNSAELDTIKRSIDLVKEDPNYTITGIYILGYASPEARVAYNLKLSQNRANSLVKYIQKLEASIDPDIFHAVGMGEDWAGLKYQLDIIPKLLKIDEVKKIYNECTGDQDACELRFRALRPSDIYRRLLLEAYPPLRRSEYRIEYNIRQFELEEARRMIKERPEMLSLEEIYNVAVSYEKGSDEYNYAMAVALRYYPSSAATLNDSAMESISKGDYASAVSLLEAAEVTASTPVLLNTLAVAYANSGEYFKAQEAFEKASQNDCQSAKHNLSELLKVIDQL